MKNEVVKLLIDYIKPVIPFFKKIYLRWKNRNKFFVEDYKNPKEDKLYCYSKKISKNKYGVFWSNEKEPVRIYQKPEHNNPKKLSEQYAEKLAREKAKSTQ